MEYYRIVSCLEIPSLRRRTQVQVVIRRGRRGYRGEESDKKADGLHRGRRDIT
ncbi:hypothetical protein E4U55_000338 [Claviceps digitariae]|nr:hypothetical protein E4U55_000338 [Claviceps digitariae]